MEFFFAYSVSKRPHETFEKKASNLDQDMTILRHVIRKLKRVDFRIFNLKEWFGEKSKS